MLYYTRFTSTLATGPRVDPPLPPPSHTARAQSRRTPHLSFFSSLPRYLFGIRPTAPGFVSLAVRPAVGDLQFGSYALPTVRGRVTVSFNQVRYYLHN